ncbi:hypothetical protein TG4357_02886 [Thalassovita gelatinovora]|uniref:Lipoprotein n=1 Tax=Thalassovita gelatinovora TaxID=53501 RepID=A0A0P1FGZ6_THAGE|nr:hypothetical protein [Thalassovita gelatinovora]QIZ81888.1 hypothetical protein HFZ77_16065 [Thalassovita gelatinovora]CUH67223.1 hypothetical protein TG4357_02886 [Thalassovita gelatinovora]SEP78153.1 hypothetical protein SAMN04488043_101374 [Thalassovita gelatinovora]
MRGFILALCAVTATAGCVVKKDPPIADDVLAKSIYRHDGPPALTLYTMVNNSNGSGAHSSLMINGSQRVIFDPAGSFRKHGIVARNDVVYNVTPQLQDVYARFHARKTFHVVVQRMEVSPETAEKALQLAMSYGEVPDAMCSQSTSTILSQLPELNIKPTYYPNNLSEQFSQVPTVSTQQLYEYDDEDRFKAFETYDPERVKQQNNS